MLVLSRKSQEKIQIGDGIVVTILKVKGQSVRIGIEAPRDVRIVRTELEEEPAAAMASAANPAVAADCLKGSLSQRISLRRQSLACGKLRRHNRINRVAEIDRTTGRPQPTPPLVGRNGGDGKAVA